MQEIKISGREAGQRLDKFLGKYLREAGSGFLYKMLRKKNITLNGKRADGSERLAEGDCLRLFLAEETIRKFQGAKEHLQTGIALDLVYEDSQVLLLNKPAGMLSQKAAPGDVSLCEHLISYLLRSGQITEEELTRFRPGVCNRLDRNTSGLVAAGKTLTGLQALSELFRSRRLEKYYLALVRGTGIRAKRAEAYLVKDGTTNTVTIQMAGQGRSSGVPDVPAGAARIVTAYEPVSEGGGATLLKVHLITGKTHQIRAQLAASGHPILGDRKYGGRPRFPQAEPGRQMLHAWELVFPEALPELPALAGKVLRAPLPEDFQRCLSRLGMEEPGEKAR